MIRDMVPETAGRVTRPTSTNADAGPSQRRAVSLDHPASAAVPLGGSSAAPLPAALQAGMESLSGVALDGVRVHRQSSRPAAIGAHAYAQGHDIHLAPGQERHLPHEAWHVVQQTLGRVPATRHLAGGVPLNDDAGLEREADAMAARALATTRPRPAALQRKTASGIVQRVSLMGAWRWSAYRDGLAGEEACDAIDTTEAKTTIRMVRDAQGALTNRIITLHVYANSAWRAAGTVTMDRAQVPGPLVDGQPGPMIWDDSILTLHTAAAGGAGNAGVATHLFPATLRWINRHLRGVQRISMNPAGGAAAKSVIESLSASFGGAAMHAQANAERTARKAAGGPVIGSDAGGGSLNTWDTRLNAEHMSDLSALETAPAGLTIGADGMTLAGPAAPNEIAHLRAQRDAFVQYMTTHQAAQAQAAQQGQPPPAPLNVSVDPNHPAAAYFQMARALTDPAIDAAPKAAARILRLARLSMRSGPRGLGGQGDAGYQIGLSGVALARVLPRAILP